ncbi:MAG: hypothetical protein Alis3KO_05620 [Aliiglaciecola sp.]
MNDPEYDRIVNDPEFAKSVNKLLRLARQWSGTSPIAAMVLLSAYDGPKYTFASSSLQSFDPYTLSCALHVITVRARTGISPHEAKGIGHEPLIALMERYESSADLSLL